MEGLIDYAGLFPPAQLDMEPAAQEFARRQRGEDRWMLGRFIVPVSRLDELAAAAADLMPREPGLPAWRLSVLPGADWPADRARIEAWNKAYAARLDDGDGGGCAEIDAIEVKVGNEDEASRAALAFRGLEIFCEVPWEPHPGKLLAALNRHVQAGMRAKIRTGSVMADDIPTASQVARFLDAALSAGVPMKATAGLHHPLHGDYPLTYEPNSPRGDMHGFLNLFLGAALLRAGKVEVAELEELLEERSVEAFEVTATEVGWKHARLTHAELAASRASFALSYGSCSFVEPVEELRQLGLL